MTEQRRPRLKSRIVADCTRRYLDHARHYHSDDVSPHDKQFHAGAMHAYARVISEVTRVSLAVSKAGLRQLFDEGFRP